MPVTISNIKYDPSFYVKENGGLIQFDFDITMVCGGGAQLAPTFVWILELRDENGNVITTQDPATGATSYARVQREDPTQGGSAHVRYFWPEPPIPDGGARPYITVEMSCEKDITTTTIGFCTGVTVDTTVWAYGSCGDYGPPIPTCETCTQSGCYPLPGGNTAFHCPAPWEA